MFNRLDIVRTCRACFAVFGSVNAEILAEQVLEHSAEIEICNGNLRAVAEYTEIGIQRVTDHIHANKRLLGRYHRAVRLGNDVLDKTQAEFHVPVGKVDVCNKVKREIGHVLVAELVDDVEFERRAAYRAVGADKAENHVKQGRQIDDVARVFFAAAAVQGDAEAKLDARFRVLELDVVVILGVAFAVANDVAIVVFVSHLLVFIDGEVFVDFRVQSAERNHDCEVALFEICAVRCFDKFARCGIVCVSVACPCGICVRDKRVIVRGNENVIVVAVFGCERIVFTVLHEFRTVPVGSLCVFAVRTVFIVVFGNGEIERRAHLEAEIDIDARFITEEVDCDTARIFGVGRAKFRQELSNALQNLAVAVCEHCDKVCKQRFVETNRDEVVCDKQSTKHNVDYAPHVCGDDARADFFVIVCRNVCLSGGCVRLEQGRQVETVDNAVGEEVAPAHDVADFVHVDVEIKFAVSHFNPQVALWSFVAVEVGVVGEFEIEFCTFEHLQESDALVACKHLEEIFGHEIDLQINAETDCALELLVLLQRRCDEVQVVANGRIANELGHLIRPVDDVVKRHEHIEFRADFHTLEIRKHACHVKLAAAKNVADVERECLGVVGEVGGELVCLDGRVGIEVFPARVGGARHVACSVRIVLDAVLRSFGTRVERANVRCARVIVDRARGVRSVAVRLEQVGVAVVVGIDRHVLLAVQSDFSCKLVCVCLRILVFESVLQVAAAREALERALGLDDVVEVVVKHVQSAVVRLELLGGVKVSVIA